MELFNHGSVKKVADRITRRSCSSKGVNNQMEVYDRLKKSGGDGKNTTKAQNLIIMRSQRLFTEGGFIF